MNVYLIAGHGDGDPGAVVGQFVEADLTRQLVRNICDVTGWKCFDPSINAYKDTNILLKTIPSDTEMVIEVHFNAYTDASANGMEIWIPRGVMLSDYSVNLTAMLTSLTSTIGIRYRGVKRGDLRVITKVNSIGIPALLLEVCFLTSPADMVKYDPATIADTLATFLNSKNDKPTQTLEPWYKEYTDRCAALGLVRDGRYTENVTRAELCAVVSRLLDIIEEGEVDET